jgi:hypothetical protein
LKGQQMDPQIRDSQMTSKASSEAYQVFVWS